MTIVCSRTIYGDIHEADSRWQIGRHECQRFPLLRKDLEECHVVSFTKEGAHRRAKTPFAAIGADQ